MLALRDVDVNLEDGFVLVRRSARKGARALKALREQLLARRPNSRGFVFPSPRSDSVWNSDNFRADVFAKTVKRAAATVKPARRTDFERLDFHDLRHTFASLMIAAGAIRSSSPRRSGTATSTADPTRHSFGSVTATSIQDRPARLQRRWIGT